MYWRTDFWMTAGFLSETVKFLSVEEVAQLIKESACNARDFLQCRRPGFEPWVRKIPSKRKWQSTLVFLPVTSHEHRFLAGYNPWTTRVKYDLATKTSSSEQSFKKLKGKSKEKPTKIVKLYFFTPQKYILVTETQ